MYLQNLSLQQDQLSHRPACASTNGKQRNDNDENKLRHDLSGAKAAVRNAGPPAAGRGCNDSVIAPMHSPHGIEVRSKIAEGRESGRYDFRMNRDSVDYEAGTTFCVFTLLGSAYVLVCG